MSLKQHTSDARAVLIDRASESGEYDTVDGYEAKSAPNSELHLAIVLGPGRAAQTSSTLAGVSWWQSFVCHVFHPLDLMDEDAETMVDPRVSDARDSFIDALMADVSLSPGVELDPQGAFGPEPLRADPAYLDQEGTKYRTESIVVPVIIYNAWNPGRT